MVEQERRAQRWGIRIFFTYPHSSGPRGTNENTHGLRRQYWPKCTNFFICTQRELNPIAQRLNTSRRKCLIWAMLQEVFTQLRYQSPVALGA
ncbi:MAG: hypothetical protein NPIRA06_06410 [Nitrospirales bacterium]|nr:MAG: hypothetical protein NPIRA06_06410 [Nitrospirales bacterium]